MASSWMIWSAVFSSARLSSALQILIYLPLTLSTLSKPAFLLLSFLLFVHSLIHGTLSLLWNSPLLSVLQLPMHPFLLLVCFNIFADSIRPWLAATTFWWEKFLQLCSPGYIVMEGMSSLLVAQKLGRVGKELVGEGETYQFGLLIAAAAAYVTSAWWIIVSYPTAAASPLSSTLLGVALTTFIFLTIIGFVLRRTNVIESSTLSLMLAYNIWLCGVNQTASVDPASSYTPLLGNILPHLQTLVIFITNTLPKPVLIALLYRLIIMHFASRILPTLGQDHWDSVEGDAGDASERPSSRFSHAILTYRQAIFVMTYSHLLLLDDSSQIWWRWMNVFFLLITWAIELLMESDDDIVTKEWKVE
ncbi:hypothetical protein K474DRAFT_1703305 [Panus rudis PR-1116 ss-1]|nr:hypothetical protein K474DRAFT_1703305 [Panus rudis PR-1116 ss-1]